jgi:hypothetical protein
MGHPPEREASGSQASGSRAAAKVVCSGQPRSVHRNKMRMPARPVRLRRRRPAGAGHKDRNIQPAPATSRARLPAAASIYRGFIPDLPRTPEWESWLIAFCTKQISGIARLSRALLCPPVSEAEGRRGRL